ncbi:MAG: hypothetical protein ABJF23_27140 [Bryobacteraceae bacterium]
MTRLTILLGMLVSLLAGCRFGMTAAKYRPAQEPKGVTLRIKTSQAQLVGELIEVSDSGVVLLSDQKVRLIPYTAILSSEADQTGSRYRLSKGQPPKPDVQVHLRLLSRFPQGLTPEITQQLLALHGQTEMAPANQ